MGEDGAPMIEMSVHPIESLTRLFVPGAELASSDPSEDANRRVRRYDSSLSSDLKKMCAHAMSSTPDGFVLGAGPM